MPSLRVANGVIAIKILQAFRFYSAAAASTVDTAENTHLRLADAPKRYALMFLAASLRCCRTSTARTSSHARSRRSALVSLKSLPQAAANALFDSSRLSAVPLVQRGIVMGTVTCHLQVPSSSRMRPIASPSCRRMKSFFTLGQVRPALSVIVLAMVAPEASQHDATPKR